ncbi:hypothetical protein ACFL08_00010 [Patescibacteria group bacterium]
MFTKKVLLSQNDLIQIVLSRVRQNGPSDSSVSLKSRMIMDLICDPYHGLQLPVDFSIKLASVCDALLGQEDVLSEFVNASVGDIRWSMFSVAVPLKDKDSRGRFHGYPLNRPCVVIETDDNGQGKAMDIEGKVGGFLPRNRQAIRMATCKEIEELLSIRITLEINQCEDIDTIVDGIAGGVS